MAVNALAFSKKQILVPAILLASCLLSACGSASGADAASEMGRKSHLKVPVTGTGGSTTTTTTPPPAPSSATYDTSVGLGVDANGYALLPLRAGARRFFVNSATGSDGNGCSGAQQAGTPMRSIAAAAACVAGGNGDQVLVAEGTSYSEGLPNLDFKAGSSAAYPTVFQSYDPADPSNESTYGHAANGRRPVINRGANSQSLTCCSTSPASYLAIRGFDINPGNLPDMVMSIVGSAGLPNNYVLIENNIFRYTMLVLQQPDANRGVHHVVRKNAFYGEWSATAHAQGIYNAGIDGLTVEDNVFWHVGWKVGVSRDTDPTLGGPTMFRHALYQYQTTSAVIRRNLFIDASATGCSCRGDTNISENVFIDNPISIIAGLGDHYDTTSPNGVSIDVGYNAIIGDADINSSSPRGGAILTGNGKQGSTVHNNLIARSRDPNAVNVSVFATDANFLQPSYIAINDNLEYLWATAGKVKQIGGTYLSQDLPTYAGNAWSDPISGTNTNSGSKQFPNAYTSAQLFAALGCTDKATCTLRMVETPEAGWGASARLLLWQGYAMP